MASKTAADLQQEFANKNALCAQQPLSTILVLVVRSGNSDVLNSKNYTCHHVITKVKQNSDGATRAFTDEFGNVFADWESFKEDNKFDYGVIVSPLNGVYTLNNDGVVKLEQWEKRADKIAIESKTAGEFQQDFGNETISLGSNCNSNLIYVLVTNSKELEEAENSREFTSHPVIRSSVPKQYEAFVDEDGNSYNGWDSYKRENKLNDGILVAPKNGCYSFDTNNRVELEIWKTSELSVAIPVIESEPPTIREYHYNLALEVQSDDGLTTSTISVLVTKETNMYDALNSREFSSHTIVRILNATTGVQSFKDECEIEYMSWDLFVSGNRLPEGIMVAPKNGSYCFDKNGDVELEVCLTPACIPKPRGDSLRPTIRNLQQHYAVMNKYLKEDTIVLHVLHTSKYHDNVLDVIEFKDIVVKQNKCKGGSTLFYEDENGVSYLNWNTYLSSLPGGMSVSPKDGEYTFDENGNVQLLVMYKEGKVQAKTNTIRSVSNVQQDFANSSGFKREIIWDLLSKDQSTVLKKKIKQLIPDQERGNTKIAEMRNAIFSSVWAQRKYTNYNSLSAIIYVLVTKCNTKIKALNSENFSCHPVFRTRKCIDDDNSSNCCMIFVDEFGRVYRNWKTYISDNDLPEGLMVAPRNGVYTIDDDGKVQLEVHTTPNGGDGRKLIGFTDSATAVAGLGAAAVPIAGMMITVAPAVLLGAGAVCAATAAYSTVRSIYTLFDRKQHEQPIGLNSSQARNAWLGVGAGVVGMGAARATRAVTTAAAAGREVSLATEIVANGMNISSIVLSGTGVANGMLDIILKVRDDEKVSSLDIVQVAASFVLFTHSVQNFRYASTLVNETQHATIQDYRRSLSNRQRKMFDKMSKETIRIRGANRGNIDIIRGVNDLPTKQYLNDLYKVNKKLNQAKVRPAFGVAGDGVVLNNEVSIDTKVLRNNLQNNQGPNVLETVKQPIPVSHSKVNVATNSPLFLNNALGSIILPNNIEIFFATYGFRLFELISNQESFEDIITIMADAFSQDTFNFLMKLAQEFVEKKLDDLKKTVKVFISAETILYRIFVYCEENCFEQSYEYLSRKKDAIMKALQDYFLSFRTFSYSGSRRCEICSGLYSIVEL
ncbi:uncharacterized protein LOC101448794 isoform X2 [Ceratitis capitata]|uniref:uncharacterized protein LOC101448794 isoform X2 n=1 Tax=Ceratitis capitata TaxID=7213 RepID=UPI0003298DA9|nr:uncharacterized protein LOC101448794 isoform X2 [Ceratitis capitata]